MAERFLIEHHRVRRIQRAWRLSKQRTHAAVSIQSAWRQYMAIQMEKRNLAARVIQSAWLQAYLVPDYELCKRRMAVVQMRWRS